MPKVDWFYFRNGWTSSARAREFLAKHKIDTPEIVDARKNILKEKDAKELLKFAGHLYAAKGKKTVHVDLKKENVTRDIIEKLILGPTDNLRAPTIRTGKKIIIGFNEEMFKEAFGIQ